MSVIYKYLGSAQTGLSLVRVFAVMVKVMRVMVGDRLAGLTLIFHCLDLINGHAYMYVCMLLIKMLPLSGMNYDMIYVILLEWYKVLHCPGRVQVPRSGHWSKAL